MLSEEVRQALNNWSNSFVNSTEWKNAIEAMRAFSAFLPAPYKPKVRSGVKNRWGDRVRTR